MTFKISILARSLLSKIKKSRNRKLTESEEFYTLTPTYIHRYTAKR